MPQWIAHSAEENIQMQPYELHVENVYKYVVKRYKEVEKHFSNKRQWRYMLRCTVIAAIYHDMGKLDDACQDILTGRIVAEKMLNHVASGTIHLVKRYEKTGDPIFVFAAYLVHAHHIGLQNFSIECFEKKNVAFFGEPKYQVMEGFYDTKDISAYGLSQGMSVHEYVSKRLNTHVKRHNEATKNLELNEFDCEKFVGDFTPTSIRIMLSILADADHTDTTINYGGLVPNIVPLKAKERIKKLDKFVDGLVKKDTPIYKLREELYAVTSEHVFNNAFMLMDASVGCGKTFSSAKLGLRAALEYDQDRFIYVAPFSNLINQTTDALRNGLCLDGENKEEVVGEFCIQMEYEDVRLRRFSRLWVNPIVCTTAVQFMESLASNKTSRLRKLHRYIGSFITIDEYPQSMPYNLWPLSFRYLKDLRDNFNVKVLFASGSSVELWDTTLLEDCYVDKVVPTELFEKMQKMDQKRCKVIRDAVPPFDSIDDFCDFVASISGRSKLVIADTVRNATNIFQTLTDNNKFLLTSAVTPKHRKVIVRQIKEVLNRNEQVIVVATSCIECGVDLSFEVGFREESTHGSIVQTKGRINRHCEHDTANLYLFSFSNKAKKERLVTENIRLRKAKDIALELEEEDLNAECCTLVAQQEIDVMRRDEIRLQEYLLRADDRKNLDNIRENFHIISTFTLIAIIDHNIVNRLRQEDIVRPDEIYSNSVQIYFSKLEYLLGKGLIEPVFDDGDGRFDGSLYQWNGEYDLTGLGILAEPLYLERSLTF